MVIEDEAWWEGALALVAEPGGGAVGPARMRQAGWMQTRADLLSDDPSLVVAQATRQGFVFTRQQALALGARSADLRRLVSRGSWSAPWRGVLCPLPASHDSRPNGTSPEIPIAALVRSRGGSAASHESAAVLLGLPALRPTPRVVLTKVQASEAGGWNGCLIHAAPLPPAEIESWFGVPVTTTARTIVDIARSSGAGAGLVTADAALHEGLVTRAQLLASLRRARRRPGVRAARRVVDLADGRAESPLESLTRLCIDAAGLPIPELQAVIPTARGDYRVDFLFRSRHVVLEADGKLKYRGDSDALWREKLRQEAIERAGYRVLRVTWDDVVNHEAETVARIRHALNRTLATV